VTDERTVVDEEVDALEGGQRLVNEPRDLRLAADVARNGVDHAALAAAASQLVPQLLCRCFQPLGVPALVNACQLPMRCDASQELYGGAPGGDDDRAAERRELVRDALADARASSRHDRLPPRTAV